MNFAELKKQKKEIKKEIVPEDNEVDMDELMNIADKITEKKSIKRAPRINIDSYHKSIDIEILRERLNEKNLCMSKKTIEKIMNVINELTRD